MKTYLVTFFTDKRANGYAVINAPNPKIAESILKTQGRERENHYHIVHIEELFAPCQTLAIVNEGITTGGMSAYEIAVHLGFRGTAEEFIKSLHGKDGKDGDPGPQGIQGEQGLSAYEIAVLHYGFEGTESEWMDMLYRGDVPLLYTPSSAIPEEAMSTPVGNLTSKTRVQLERMTLSQVFDGILFKELPAFVNYNKEDNEVTSKGSLEVGSKYTYENFDISSAEATYKYVNGQEQTKEWTANYSTSQEATVRFGNNNSFSVQFTLSWDQIPVLTTSYGNPQTDVVLSNQSKTVEGKLAGYYKYGWLSSSSAPSSLNWNTLEWNKVPITSQLNKTVINTTTQSSYVYIALPSALKITLVEVRNPFDTTVWKDLTASASNLMSGSSPIQINSLSTLNKYNIWRICKSAPNQGDVNDVTANNSPIRITTAAN